MSYDVHTKLIPSQALKVRIMLKVILILLMIRQNALISHNSIITIFGSTPRIFFTTTMRIMYLKTSMKQSLEIIK